MAIPTTFNEKVGIYIYLLMLCTKFKQSTFINLAVTAVCSCSAVFIARSAFLFHNSHSQIGCRFPRSPHEESQTHRQQWIGTYKALMDSEYLLNYEK